MFLKRSKSVLFGEAKQVLVYFRRVLNKPNYVDTPYPPILPFTKKSVLIYIAS